MLPIITQIEKLFNLNSDQGEINVEAVLNYCQPNSKPSLRDVSHISLVDEEE